MDAIDIERLAERWVQEWEVSADENRVRSKDPEVIEAHEIVTGFHFDERHDLLWEFILAAFTKNMSRRVFSVLAAGPLEDLLASFGELYIDRVETLARRDPKFNDLLGGVWKNSMSDEVWERVTRSRSNGW